MKITEEQYSVQRHEIEDKYIQLAEELFEQLLDCTDWKEVDSQKVIALWLKFNENHCKEEKK